MATKTFVADKNKTVTVEGNVYTITPSNLPSNVHIYINEILLENGKPITITANSTITATVDAVTPPEITINANSYNSITLNGKAVEDMQTVALNQGDNVIDFEGATNIPNVTVNGDGIKKFTVNEVEYQPENLPYTFTPKGGVTNSIFVQGSDEAAKKITLSGTNIASATVNNVAVTLPHEFTISEDTKIAMAGEIYQVDVSSYGGATIKKNDTVVSDGNSPYHEIIDITEDTYLNFDGGHDLILDGDNVKAISVNGIRVEIADLPVTILNRAMQAKVEIHGQEPSIFHITGDHINYMTVDGNNIPVGDNGTVSYSIKTAEKVHNVIMEGTQPRQYALKFNDHDVTNISIDGQLMADGATKYISKDVYIEAEARPIPIHIETQDNVYVEIDGKDYPGNDITFNVTKPTELDVTTDSCRLTIDYGDDSYTITVPQEVVYLTAPQRDGWIFDCWSSSTLGIGNPKQVKTTIDLRGKNAGSLVAHYQRFVTCNKPNAWN